MRIVTGALGLALMTVGAVLLLTGGQLKDVALWLAGAIVLHDGIVAPLVLGVGLLLAAVPARGTVRGALIVAGCLTVVALPVLLRPGTPKNPTVLPLDYVRNWLLALAAVAVLTGVLLAARWIRRRVPRR
ncbi:hypothetical protein OG905_07070 [Streptomyces sp. NBC_00322]|uniref:hypothetical protein n=1 Tax=unclassified Streptomyces TaxID=2593676 RepID=UPI00224D47C9|nr:MULTISPECIES: hypothetical protein [unclassified Streptomyces]MCX4585228.1 hypothetical protein [Streptomyces sp. NBC_01481]HET6352958.1 hypothetical protein [Streptomyces sp.]